jgi:hypothetical protein
MDGEPVKDPFSLLLKLFVGGLHTVLELDLKTLRDVFVGDLLIERSCKGVIDFVSVKSFLHGLIHDGSWLLG